ncbi:TPA: mevalonate kinase [Methanocaldococcus jannaschii]|uniref:Mevalonate kinase n=3 Tax=Methanocaldococcus jannaschii TaxID=2190 RepID=MVK_METJA|nr:mevalonate kinase [Methanocaldococcus jannaschii]Q58487.1 RecName: Full=Mevalonate kinase; Short=MK; Short=MVK [Methanocaldococcus jannaschii DSM 2661]AAB99088.1 mevalonate kinase [Methanocaldococcus jannaschii DSM 2661]HII59489.1 mevalonate kinase [Methanocaldococcus jannaschii]
MIIETPSKVILFGEHAVVYGYRAISMAIDLTSTIEIKETQEDEIILNLNDLNKSLGLNLNEIKNINPNNFGDFKYCLCAIKNTLDYLNIEPKTGFKINISSKIPISCGLGSSASITIGTIKAVSGFYNKELKDDEIAKLGYMVEKEIQGKASITDTSTITYKGILEIKNNKFRKIKGEFEEFLKNCKFLIVYAEKRKKKTAELVNEVAKIENKDEIFKEIDKVIDEALKIKNKEDFGKLMTKNHELLKKLNISTPKLDRIVDIGNRFGFGAKLTGAGGGGCVIILVNEEKEKELLKELNKEDVRIFNCRMMN